MANKVQFGIGGVYFVNINQETGDIEKDITLNTALTSAYNSVTRVLSTATALTGFVVGDYVVVALTGVNKYAFGKVTGANAIAIDEESDDSWISDNTSVRVVKGIGAGLFKNVSVACSSTPVEFKGNNLFTREVAYTDGDVKVTVEEFILNTSALEYLNGIGSKNFNNGSAFAVMDNQFGTKVTPKDVMVVINKLKTGSTDKYEEIQLTRIKSSSLALPFNRNNFVTTNYEFNAQSKNIGDSTLLKYISE